VGAQEDGFLKRYTMDNFELVNKCCYLGDMLWKGGVDEEASRTGGVLGANSMSLHKL